MSVFLWQEQGYEAKKFVRVFEQKLVDVILEQVARKDPAHTNEVALLETPYVQ